MTCYFFTNVIYKYIKMDVRDEKNGNMENASTFDWMCMEREREQTNELKLNYHHIPHNTVNSNQLFYPFEN